MKAILLLALVVLVAADLEPMSDKQIDYVNQVQSTWKAGHNFPGKKMDDVRFYLGTYLDTPDYLKLPEKDIIPLESGLPTEFDARE